MTKLILASLAYILPTFPLGYFWHLKFFQAHYKTLGLYPDDINIPLGLLSMVIQAVTYSFIYSKMFAGLPVLEGGGEICSHRLSPLIIIHGFCCRRQTPHDVPSGLHPD